MRNKKQTQKVCFFVAILICIAFSSYKVFGNTITNTFTFNLDQSKETITYLNFKNSEFNESLRLDNESLKISTFSPPIYIDDNDPSSNWSVAKDVGICRGNGTYSQPYVIEDLVIDGFGTGSCILIGNSNVYFRIENCTVYNSGVNADNGGIKLFNVDNGKLINNSASSCGNRGILIHNNNNIIISGNTVNDNLFGIRLSNSENITISGNIVNSNYYYGISLVSSSDIKISGNTASGNNYFGIYLEGSIGNNVSGNAANYNNDFSWSGGITLASSNENIVSGNTVNNNPHGITLGLSNDNNISGNTVNKNGYGFRLSWSNSNIIRFNIIEQNNIGIYLMLSYSNEISNNTFNGNNIDFREYIEPKFIFHYIITIVIIITTIVFSGISITTFIIKKRSARNTEIKYPGVSRILAFISAIICLVGGFFYLWSTPDLPYFSPLQAIYFGVQVIIGAFISLKFQLGGSLVCLIMGLLSLVTYGFSLLFLYGIILTIIGSILGLIGAYFKKKSIKMTL